MLFKNSTIKATAKRILHEIDVVLQEIYQKDPNISIVNVLKSPDFYNRLSVQSWTCKEVGRAGAIIPEPPDHYKDDIFGLLVNVVWNIVRFELSYDPTIGTEKDIKNSSKNCPAVFNPSIMALLFY